MTPNLLPNGGGSNILNITGVPSTITKYSKESFSVTANTATTTLAFKGYNGPAWYYLDSVSLVNTTQLSNSGSGQASAVPGPAALYLLGLGLLGLVMLGANRKRFWFTQDL